MSNNYTGALVVIGYLVALVVLFGIVWFTIEQILRFVERIRGDE